MLYIYYLHVHTNSCSGSMASVDYQKLEDGESGGPIAAPPFALAKLDNDKEGLKEMA